jgi:DNA-binding beta-propeller fold protein YncE
MPALRSPSAFRSAGLALLALLALAGCEGRLRTNPLDPENPQTGGGPIGFVALGDNAVVHLTWSGVPVNVQIEGFLLERKTVGPGAFEPVTKILPQTARDFDDAAVTNDVDYQYRLSYVLEGGEVTGSPALSEARPGPEIVWVADPGSDEVIRMTPDGRARVFSIPDVRAVNRIAVQLSGGEIWATEPLDGRVRIWSAAGVPIHAFNGLSQPNALSVDPTSLTAWIAEELGPRVRRWNDNGVVQASSGTIGLPTDVEVRGGGGAWVVDNERGLLLRLEASGAISDTIDVGSDPRRLAVDALDGSVWVSRLTAGEVVHVSAAGEILARVPGLEKPYALDIDEFRDQVWIGLDGANAVQVIKRSDGTNRFRVEGILRPRGLSVLDRTGECWVIAIAAHELVRINSNGGIESRYRGLSAPYDVRVDPGPR